MNIAAYKKTVIELRPALLLVAKRITRNNEDAEDVVQEVCLKLWHRCRTSGEPDNMEAYCVTMTKNISIDKIRGRHPGEPLEELLYAEAAASLPDELLEIKEEHTLIHRIIAALPPMQGKILRLKEIEGYETDEIAELTGISVEAVRNNLSRARRQLREVYLNCLRKRETSVGVFGLNGIKQDAL